MNEESGWEKNGEMCEQNTEGITFQGQTLTGAQEKNKIFMPST